MTSPKLAYVALAVNDPETVAEGLRNVLGLMPSEVRHGSRRLPAVGVGETRLVLLAPDDPFLLWGDESSARTGVARTGAARTGAARTGVHHLGVSVPDPQTMTEQLGLTESFQWAEGLNDSGELALDPATTLGVRVRLTDWAAPDAMASAHVVRVDHIGIASEDNLAAHGLFASGFGCAVESTQTDFETRLAVESFTSDKYGVVYHSRSPEPVGGLRVSFLTLGDCELEFLQPLDAGGGHGDTLGLLGRGAGNTQGDKGAIARYIGHRGAGLHHIALRTPNVAAALHALGRAGYELIDKEGRPGSRRASIGFVHPRALGGLLLHFVEREDG